MEPGSVLSSCMHVMCLGHLSGLSAQTLLVHARPSYTSCPFSHLMQKDHNPLEWTGNSRKEGNLPLKKGRAVKRAGSPRVGPFNRKNFRVRFLVFLVRLNPGFFGPNRISLRPDRASPRLTGWPGFFFFFSF